MNKSYLVTGRAISRKIGNNEQKKIISEEIRNIFVPIISDVEGKKG